RQRLEASGRNDSRGRDPNRSERRCEDSSGGGGNQYSWSAKLGLLSPEEARRAQPKDSELARRSKARAANLRTPTGRGPSQRYNLLRRLQTPRDSPSSTFRRRSRRRWRAES